MGGRNNWIYTRFFQGSGLAVKLRTTRDKVGPVPASALHLC